MILAKRAVLKQSLQRVMFGFAEWDWQQFPKPYNLPHTKAEKRMLRDPKQNPFPKYITNLNDPLHVPGLENNQLILLYKDFIENPNSPLSSQNVAMMIYNLAKGGYLTPTVWPSLQTFISRNRGEFGIRSIFGCLYGVIRIGSLEYIQFFVDEMKGQSLTFTDMEAIEIIEAFNESKYPYTDQFKYDFWDTHFKPFYVNTITSEVRIHKYANVLRIFDAFNNFGYYHDEEIWNNILSWMQRRKGWKRTQIIEKIYPLTGTFEKAKEVFDHYYAELSQSPDVLWRYNLEQLRLYSSEEMIAKSQLNIQMKPADRTIFDRKDQKEANQTYYQWLKDGARQKEAELVRDKAQSLAYAIKNRYDSLKSDNVDFSKLSVEEFEDLFGTYDKSIMYEGSTELLENIEEQPEEEIAKKDQKKNNQSEGKKKKA